MDKISPIKERILQYIEIQNIKKTDFCEKTGISYSNMKGAGLYSEIGGYQIGKILSIYPDLSAEWLLTGKGKMIVANDNLAQQFENPTIDEIVNKFIDLLKKRDDQIDRLLTLLEQEQKK